MDQDHQRYQNQDITGQRESPFLAEMGVPVINRRPGEDKKNRNRGQAETRDNIDQEK